MVLNLNANEFLRLSGARGTTVWRWWRTRASTLVKRLADGMLERHTLRELESLSDHSLRDIGLNRGDIECAARRCA